MKMVKLPDGTEATEFDSWIVMWDGKPLSGWGSEGLAKHALVLKKQEYADQFKAIPAPLSSIHKAPFTVRRER